MLRLQQMPVRVSEILNPTPPPPPPPPVPPAPTWKEATILALLKSKPDEGYSCGEIDTHITFEKVKKFIGPTGTALVVNLLAVAIAGPPTPAPEETTQEAIDSLLEKGMIKTHDYKGKPLYWFASNDV